MYLALTGIQNTLPSMQMLCERRACLNDRTGLQSVHGFHKGTRAAWVWSGSFSPLAYAFPFGAILPCEQGSMEGECDAIHGQHHDLDPGAFRMSLHDVAGHDAREPIVRIVGR
jgi:hypothetical protein